MPYGRLCCTYHQLKYSSPNSSNVFFLKPGAPVACVVQGDTQRSVHGKSKTIKPGENLDDNYHKTRRHKREEPAIPIPFNNQLKHNDHVTVISITTQSHQQEKLRQN